MVCYDISEQGPRTKLAALLELQGLERVQYSVFVGRVPPQRWAKVWADLEVFFERYCQETDRVYAHVIREEHFKGMSVLGQELDMGWILQEQLVLFF